LPLAVVGDAPYASQFITALGKAAAQDPRVKLLGAHYGSEYQVLRSHAAAYVQATEVGGTHPALVEAMGFGNCVIAHDTPENRETIGEAGFGYNGHAPVESLRALLQQLVDAPALVVAARERARERARLHFSWEQVTDAYETLFRRMLGQGVPAPRALRVQRSDE
jgi:glycosyltransferase involved in cell wall biosynthesis